MCVGLGAMNQQQRDADGDEESEEENDHSVGFYRRQTQPFSRCPYTTETMKLPQFAPLECRPCAAARLGYPSTLL